ncbi:uncharacterized protein K452DRAFT_116774 [Aplosporella prunicola CBS 121167]|uniref:Uncharacterized protein n=1 Tax=Aplosporella prunicola CBS 121167 TaxID=1176127 RepID=A0A6A6B2C9_9PEZI|nr:uncharacterized protein K452DRAFT_116774 [Aplosporella prunicola CBS 121167]KAF2136891.1 hypothetical protein K452DRAFT_116774 [Aplosporella prunicola CBS 121167]
MSSCLWSRKKVDHWARMTVMSHQRCFTYSLPGLCRLMSVQLSKPQPPRRLFRFRECNQQVTHSTDVPYPRQRHWTICGGNQREIYLALSMIPIAPRNFLSMSRKEKQTETAYVWLSRTSFLVLSFLIVVPPRFSQFPGDCSSLPWRYILVSHLLLTSLSLRGCGLFRSARTLIYLTDHPNFFPSCCVSFWRCRVIENTAVRGVMRLMLRPALP